jgi:carboxymethylenebutenolidase
MGRTCINRQDGSHLARGFAAAVVPITEATITTDSEGLDAGEVSIQSGGLEIPAYRAMPISGERFPTVLVVQEIFGKHAHVRDLCRRLAKAGYFAVAPELRFRQLSVSAKEEREELRLRLVPKISDDVDKIMSDLGATVKWADATGKGDTSRLAITGFCWGGHAVWLYAARSSEPNTGAAWYAGLREALKSAGEVTDVIVLPNEGRRVSGDYPRGPDSKAASEAWSRIMAWFKTNGA